MCIFIWLDATGGGYDYNPPKDINYLPPATVPPVPVYGLPPDVSGAGYDYNPPKDNSYLPPPSPPVYGPPPLYNYPQTSFYKPAHPIPYHSHDSFLAKLKSKISLFTLGKIVLKLLIFKK